ncbi:RDD family protein [Gangjinia marincola]|uniref:RDD family protein n=1 Tax=Gangjinia marincola TaxID=578463 RepID=A0ABP3XSS4_9FLAO
MDNFQIETAQNVSIHQPVANVGDRIFAFIIDVLVLVAYATLIFVAAGFIGMDSFDEWVFQLAVGLPIFLYHLLMETFNDGQSLGKMVMKIRVVLVNGGKPAFSNYAIRWLLRLIDITFSSGSVAVISLLFSRKGQRLGDLAAKTTVITEARRTSFANTLLVDLPEDYVPKYSQVTVFTDQEIQSIKTIFTKARRSSNHKVILSLSNRISSVLEITPEEKPLLFVDRVIKDYNYYTQQ